MLAKYIALLIAWSVKKYQSLAPKRIRRSCRFEPSCSVYMLMSVKKYGPYLGLCKGVKRLLRCKRPFGGVDYP